MTSKDVKSSSVLPKSMRRAAPAPLSRSVLVEKDGLETSDTPTPPSTPPDVSHLSADDLITIYREGKGGATKHKWQQAFKNDFAPSALAVATPDLIGTVAQGSDAPYTRIGTQIRWRAFTIRGIAVWTATNISGVDAQLQEELIPAPVRIVIFWDKMPLVVGTNATTEPSCIWAENVLTPTGMGAMVNTGAMANPTYDNSIAPYNPNTHGTRYEILLNKVIYPRRLNTSGNSGAAASARSGNMVHFEYHLDLKGKKQTYSSTASSSAVDNQMKIFVVADAAGTGSPAQSVKWNAAATFEDLET